jgi:glycerol-1-phosphate dehydrogenase [NAD(P)+]
VSDSRSTSGPLPAPTPPAVPATPASMPTVPAAMPTQPATTIDDVLGQLLRGELPDPDGGPPLAVPVRSIAIERSLDGDEVALVRGLGLGGRLALVSDPDTHAALGARVERALASAFAVESVQLDRRPAPDEDNVSRIQAAAAAAGADALVAVGAGTVNDLCKVAAARLGRPYVVFGTAPSMNGYTAASASIAAAGVKRSLPAAAPVGAFFDLEVACRAPVRLIRAGVGECVCRPTAQADWLLAHLLLDRPYREAPFRMLAADEPELYAHADAVVAGDVELMARLMRLLVLSGLGMALCGGSDPASQGEHMLAHYVQMMWPRSADSAYHGEHTGVCAIAMAELQNRLLARGSLPPLRPTRTTEADLIAEFGPERGAAAWLRFCRKRLTADDVDAANRRLAGWSELRAPIAAVARPADQLRAVIAAAGGATRPEQIGWPPDRFRRAWRGARLLRERFGFLDLAAELDLLGAPG